MKKSVESSLENLRQRLERLQAILAGSRLKYPPAEYLGDLRFQRRRWSEMLGEAAATSSTWYENPAAISNIEERLSVVSQILSLYGQIRAAELGGWIDAILKASPTFCPTGRFPFSSLSEMNHDFFYLTKNEQIQARTHDGRDFLYRPTLEGEAVYRIPASGQWVSIPSFAETKLPGSSEPFYWCAMPLFLNRHRLELRIVNRADVLPPHPMGQESAESLQKELRAAFQAANGVIS